MVSKEKREELFHLVNDAPGFHLTAHAADIIVERIIKAGWQWHPPKLDDFDLDYNKVALKEYPDPTPEQEVEFIDRIIAGLPADAVMLHRDPSKDSAGDVTHVSAVLYDVASLYPQEVKELWTRIPEFDNYEIDYISKSVRSRWTKRTLETTDEGGTLYTEMHDKDGFPHYVSVDYAYEMTFGK